MKYTFLFFWTFDFKRKKRFADFFRAIAWNTKKKIFKKYWKNTIQESCKKKVRFAPGTTNHTFFWLTLYFSNLILYIYLCSHKISSIKISRERSWFAIYKIYKMRNICFFRSLKVNLCFPFFLLDFYILQLIIVGNPRLSSFKHSKGNFFFCHF